VRCNKRQPAFWSRLLARLPGLEPDELLFVDDAPPNVEAAREAGLQAELYTTVEAVAQLIA